MITCIAIDDEPLALRQIEAYIRKTPFLELLAGFESALDALSFLNNAPVDLMFVDVEMPDLSGMEFVKSLRHKPLVVFTTAYSEYAVEGFRVDALDYLLKPIGYPAFLEAAHKAKERIGQTDIGARNSLTELFVKADGRSVRVSLHEIDYIEGMREYVRLHLHHKKPIITLMSMKKLEELLPSDKFMRVHRSYIVNLAAIEIVERNRIVFPNSVYIPIGEQYADAFKHFLQGRSLQ